MENLFKSIRLNEFLIFISYIFWNLNIIYQIYYFNKINIKIENVYYLKNFFQKDLIEFELIYRFQT